MILLNLMTFFFIKPKKFLRMIFFLRVLLKERAIGSLYLSLVPDFQTFFFNKAFSFKLLEILLIIIKIITIILIKIQ